MIRSLGKEILPFLNSDVRTYSETFAGIEAISG